MQRSGSKVILIARQGKIARGLPSLALALALTARMRAMRARRLCTNKDDENMRGLLTLLLFAAAGTCAEYLMRRSEVQWEGMGESGSSQELKLGSGAENVPLMAELPGTASGDGPITLLTEGGGSGGGSGSGSGSGGPPFINVIIMMVSLQKLF